MNMVSTADLIELKRRKDTRRNRVRLTNVQRKMFNSEFTIIHPTIVTAS